MTLIPPLTLDSCIPKQLSILNLSQFRRYLFSLDLTGLALLVLSSNEAANLYSSTQFCACLFRCSCLIPHSLIKSNIPEFYFEMICSV